MARRSGVTIDIEASDKATPTIAELGKTFKRLPDGFSKAASAMTIVEGAADGMGGAFATATGKVSQMVSLITAGGPVGMAIAGLTAAVAVLKIAFDEYNRSAADAVKANEAIAGVMAKNYEKSAKMADDLETLRRKLRDYGKDEAALSQEEIGRRQKGLQTIRDQIAAQTTRLGQVNSEIVAIARLNLEEGRSAEPRKRALAEEQAYLLANIQQNKNLAEVYSKQLETAHKIAAAKTELHSLDVNNDKLKEKLPEQEREAAEAARRALEVRKQAAAENARLAAVDLASLARQGKAQDAADAKKLAAQESMQKKLAQKSTQKALESERHMLETQADYWRTFAAAASQSISIIGDEFAAVAAGEKSFAAAAGSSALRMAETIILTAAASAAAKQLEAHAFLPFVGLAIGGAAAAAIFGVIRGYMSKLPKAAEGYMVRGGLPGIDSVPVMAQAGEPILSRKQWGAIERLAKRLESTGSRGADRRVSVVANFSSLIPSTGAQADRAALAFGARLAKAGV